MMQRAIRDEYLEGFVLVTVELPEPLRVIMGAPENVKFVTVTMRDDGKDAEEDAFSQVVAGSREEGLENHEAVRLEILAGTHERGEIPYPKIDPEDLSPEQMESIIRWAGNTAVDEAVARARDGKNPWDKEQEADARANLADQLRDKLVNMGQKEDEDLPGQYL